VAADACPVDRYKPRRTLSRSRLTLIQLLAGMVMALTPAASHAALTTFGSPLSVPATLNTTENLNYKGTFTPVPPAPDAPNGIFHTNHYGADTALWNVGLASGEPSAPAGGQALKVSLEGCAQPAAGGPPPLTQIHFQDITPLPGGGAKVNLTSQSFEIPVCGQSGAGESTITSYEPDGLCVSQGDYVDFNDEGGYVENVYRSGVPYQVIGSVKGSTLDSFIRGGGTGNGATMSSSDTTANDGFASNEGEELMLQTTLGTGPDALYGCPGGTKGAPPAPVAHTVAPPSTPLSVGKQKDGVNHLRVVGVAMYCRLSSACQGVATLNALGRPVRYGNSHFSIPARTTTRVPIRVTSQVIKTLRKHRRGVDAQLSVVVGTQTVSQSIKLML